METTPDAADSAELIRFFHRNRRFYLIVLSAAVALGVLLTFLATPQYHSSGIVFPTNSNSVETVIDNPTFGYDIEADRLLQMFQSEEVIDSLAEKFNLYKVYGIDREDLKAQDLLRRQYKQSFEFTRTPYMSIIINATSPEPKLSADMVNYIITLSDGMRNRIYKKNMYTAYKSIEGEYLHGRMMVDSLQATVERLRAQTNSNLVALVNNQVILQNSAQVKESPLQTKLERTLNQYIFEQNNLNEIAARYQRAKAQYERPLTLVYVLQKAKPSYIKSSPSFLFNVSVAFALAFLFTTGGLMLREKYQSLKLNG